MVDFNSDGALGTNRSHILDLVVLQRRDDFINAYEEYRFSVLQNGSDSATKLFKLKSRLESILLEIDRLLFRRVKEVHKTTYEELKTLINSDEVKIDNVMRAFNLINLILDELNITRIDTRRKIDYTDIEASNTSKGL